MESRERSGESENEIEVCRDFNCNSLSSGHTRNILETLLGLGLANVKTPFITRNLGQYANIEAAEACSFGGVEKLITSSAELTNFALNDTAIHPDVLLRIG